LSQGGSAGVARDPSMEYAVYTFRLDLSGLLHACAGDLADPNGPQGTNITPFYSLPCGAVPRLAVAIVDENAALHFASFEPDRARLTWEFEAQGWSTSGNRVSTAGGWRENPAIVSDGVGGALIGWEDHRLGSAGSDIYLQ